ncbi:PAS domain-containing sensor histidine kinase [Arcobacteraceae bacterium]|nr:PAS domain-containing sensor histidine kinase [Arcobacteraceae bacterium]
MSFDFLKINECDSALLTLLTDKLPDMLWVKDLEGKYLYANQALCDGLLMAKDISEPIGKDDVFFALRERNLHKDNSQWHTFGELCFDSDKVVIENNKAMKFEEYGNVKGQLLYLEVNKTPYYDKEGNIIGTLGSGRDITELKNTQLKLEQQYETIKEQATHVSMGEMIGNIAHQWRQPLSIISTAATGMKVEKEYGFLTDEHFYKSCDAINNNAQYLSQTIEDFRKFIKGDRIKKVFSLKKDIDSFLNLVDGTIKNNNINIELDIEKDIEINGYENELIQCLINIFNNARDALLENKIVRPYIFISIEEENDYAIIKIKDNASGIKNDILSKIFDPYFTTKHQSQGTGLGLHMTYNLIVDGMDGVIIAQNTTFTFKNDTYKGAEFIIRLPIK